MEVIALIDTNVWVSALINPHGFPARVRDAWLEGQYTIVISPPLIEELRVVLSRPRLPQRFAVSKSKADELIALVIVSARMISIEGRLKLCRDPHDDTVLETAIAGKATHIVSRDEDLTRDVDLMRELEARGIQIVTVNNFLVELTTDEAKDTEER
jgi:putative PIN family toxin of toxin-antitoxin system